MKDQTSHHNNSNPSRSICPLIIQTFCVTPLIIAILAQSNTHINTLTIIHNNTKSTNGSSSRKAHNLVIHHLKEILRFHKNNPIIANNITNHDFHSIQESKNLTQFQFASTTGNKNKQNAKIAK